MDPVTMIFGYGTVHSVMQLVVKPVADRLTAGGRKLELFEQMKNKKTSGSGSSAFEQSA